MARSVCWRGSAARDPPVSSANRSSSRASSSAAGITRSRAAASSMASGMPSSRRQIRPATCAAGSSPASGTPCAAARSVNSRTASLARIAPGSSPSAGVRSDGTRYTRSPSIPSGSRLVASSARFGHPRNSASASLAQASDHVLAVVQQYQQALPAHRAHQRVQHRAAGLLPHAQHISHRHRHHVRVGQRGQVSKPHPVPGAIGQPSRHLHGKPGLARPAGAGQRHQPPASHQTAHLGQLRIPADKARHLRGQVIQRLRGHKLWLPVDLPPTAPARKPPASTTEQRKHHTSAAHRNDRQDR